MTTATEENQTDRRQANAVCGGAGGQAQAPLAANGCERLKIKLAAYMALKLFTSKEALARHLGIGCGKVRAWVNGTKFPSARHCARLAEVGVATKAELAAMRPPRKPRVRGPNYWVRGARVYRLAEFAASA